MSLNKIFTPDFESYKNNSPIKETKIENKLISVTWKDDTKSQFHSIWLRDNCACPLCIDIATKERIYDLSDIPASIKALDVSVTHEGALKVIWSDDKHKSIYHPQWLKVHSYSKPINKKNNEQELWDSSFQAHIPSFDTQLFLEDDKVRYQFLSSVQKYGIALLTGVPKSEIDFEKIAGKIGILRDMNWGKIFSIKMDPNVGYIANGTYKITPHNDASTRERTPGIQIFQCVENTTEGGGSYWVDGFFIAKLLAEKYPEDYKLLTTIPWEFANRSEKSHYRNEQAVISLNQQNEPVEICDTYWLREPLMIDFDLVEPVYKAYRRYRELVNNPNYQIKKKLVNGDIAVINNRRVLHAREAIIKGEGSRFIRTCYSELEELESSLRMIERQANSNNSSLQ